MKKDKEQGRENQGKEGIDKGKKSWNEPNSTNWLFT